MIRPIQRESFDAAQLAARHPPKLLSRNKRIVQELALPPGASASGSIEFSRWAESELPAAFDDHPTDVTSRPGIFPYEPAHDCTVPWHMNFADEVLFGFYAGDLFAQDEIQVAEHPALASLRQALCAAGRPPVTVKDGRPTPALVTGVERRCAIRTDG